jgi:hypothetical protein
LIVVKVGCDGAEMNMVMQPTSKIRELHSKVKAECGVSGKFWSVSADADCDETAPLRLESTIQECGLFHNAVVWLELETTFCAERDALIELRDACMQQHFIPPVSKWATSLRPEVSKACLTWAHLESFTSPEQLATCHGVKVVSGHVTELELGGLRLTGNSSIIAVKSTHSYVCMRMDWKLILVATATANNFQCIAIGSGEIPKEIGDFQLLQKLKLIENQLTGVIARQYQ